MFRLSSGKSFFLTVLFLLGASSCGWRSAPETEAPTPVPFIAPEIASDIPFSTREPDVFQTEIIVSNFIDGQKTENKTFVARIGERRLSVFNAGGANEIASLAIDGKVLRINRERKIYTEETGGAAIENAGETENFIAAQWLNLKTPAQFENLGAQNDLTQFRVRADDNQNSETLVFVDENLKLPVRQEFFTLSGEQKTLTYSVELKNFKPEADETLFEIPKEYKKVSAKEFYQIRWREKFKK